MPVSITPSLLYKTAALLNAISIPGHLFLGLQTVHPAMNTIREDTKTKIAGKAAARACFNYINGALAVAALLNWQWAKTLGPKTLEEKSIFWILVANGFVDGLTYISGGEYGPLGCMWIAPACSVAAYLLF